MKILFHQEQMIYSMLQKRFGKSRNKSNGANKINDYVYE